MLGSKYAVARYAFSCILGVLQSELSFKHYTCNCGPSCITLNGSSSVLDETMLTRLKMGRRHVIPKALAGKLYEFVSHGQTLLYALQYITTTI
jgi:hypothetical protein